MEERMLNRRTVLKPALGLTAAGMVPGRGFGQASSASRRRQYRRVGDPYEALISFGQPRNVDTVIVDGRILRRGGEFTALDYAEVLKEANDTAAALRARANWS